MTDTQMSSEIKWHRLDDMDSSTYPKKIGELYLVRICNKEKGHAYSIARLYDADRYKKTHPNYRGSSKMKYLFVCDSSGIALGTKSGGHEYVDGWNDLMFTAASSSAARSQPGSSKVWLDLRK